MNLLDIIDTKVSSYTKTDRVIYEKLKKYPDHFAEKTYMEVVKEIEASPAALTRFAKKLGFNGFNEFQFQLSKDLQEKRSEAAKESTAEKFGKALIRTEESISKEQLDRIADLMIQAEHLFCFGFNSSSLPAKFLWNTLQAEFGSYVQTMDFDFIFRRYTERDVIILFSVASGSYYHTFLQMLNKSEKKDRPQVILVTMNPKHPLRKYCDEIILLPSAGGMYRTHAAVLENMIFMMFNDLLVSAIHQRKTEK